MKPPRDSQRSALYRAEQKVREGLPILSGIGEVQDYIDLLRDLGVVRRPIRARWKQGGSGNYTTAHLGRREIRFAREDWALNEMVVIHEVAHFGIFERFDYSVAFHGPEFAGLMLWAADQAFGSETAERLRMEFAVNRVRRNDRAIVEMDVERAIAACER